MERFRHHRTLHRQSDPSNRGEGAAGESELLARAHVWGAVSRESYESCERGAEAEEELRRRSNESGQ